MHRWDTVAIVGVGLVGGSVGLALRTRSLARRVVGIGRRRSSLNAARRCGTVDEVTTSLSRGVRQAELIVVCTPVSRIVQHVSEASQFCPAEAVITDAGSTKESIVTQLDDQLSGNGYFVGSHPMAGSEKTGPLSAQSELFHNRTVIVTPTRRSKGSAVQAVAGFWESLGATVVQMTPRAHDEAVAFVSHLPHLAAAALAATTSEGHRKLAATGWLDTTRIASGDAQLWQQIFSTNRNYILRSLDKFEQWLDKFRNAVAHDDQKRIIKLLEAGKRNRDALGD